MSLEMLAVVLLAVIAAVAGTTMVFVGMVETLIIMARAGFRRSRR